MEATAPVPAPLGFLEKVRVVVACAVAVLLLWTIGWRIAEPADPQMALTLSSNWARILAVWPTLLVLTLVSAGVGTILIGRRLPEAGVLAASIGLTALALCGGSMQALLAYRTIPETASRRALMLAMGFDAILWTAALAAAWVVGVLIRRWLWPDASRVAVAPAPPVTSKGKAVAAAPQEKAGWPALAVCTVVGMLVIWSTISRTQVANIARGQVIASVGGGLFVGALAARYFTGRSDPKWYALAAPVSALLSYMLGYLSSDMEWAQGSIYQPYAYLSTTPPHDLVRALPVEYVAVGVAGALLGFWWAGHLLDESRQQESS